ncbi:unnamed protein product [Orchesella dallaii]|uniref:Protein phosphatase 1 regulatory inhibitor subunit 16B n=1 Tax=Orchesella dallaii TaxID=48710 RepID=A0ABP1PM09_9HEXA
MQYLKNLQSHLPQSLWIRSHREPNKQRDFISCTRFSTSSISTCSPSAHHQNHHRNKEKALEANAPVVPEFTTSNHENISSSTFTKKENNTCESNNKRRKSIEEHLPTSQHHQSDVGNLNNSKSTRRNPNNNNHNRVHSSVHSDLNIISSFKHNFLRTRGSSLERATVVSPEVEPVILSLTPLSKSTRKKYLKKKQSGITSLFHSSTTSSIPTLPIQHHQLQLKKGDNTSELDYSGESSSEDECFRDKEGKTSPNLGRVVLSPPNSSSSGSSLKEKESLLLAVVDDPLLQLRQVHGIISKTPEKAKIGRVGDTNGNEIDDIFVTSRPSQPYFPSSSSSSSSSLSSITFPLEEKKSVTIVKSETFATPHPHRRQPPSSFFFPTDNNTTGPSGRPKTSPHWDQSNANDRKKGHLHCRDYRKVSVDCGELATRSSLEVQAKEEKKALGYYIHENFTFPDSTFSKATSSLQSQSNKVGEHDWAYSSKSKSSRLVEHYSPLKDAATAATTVGGGEIGLVLDVKPRAAGRTTGDQSSARSSSRIPTFTRDRPCSSSGGSSIFRIVSSDSCNSTTNTSTSSSDEPNSVIVVGVPSPSLGSAIPDCAPVVVFPSIALSPSTLSTASTFFLPLPAGVEGLSCSHKVNQRKKSIIQVAYNNSTNVNSEICCGVGRNRNCSIIQSLLCTKGLNLLCAPKKLLSAIFQRRNKKNKRLKGTTRSSSSSCSSSNDPSSTLNNRKASNIRRRKRRNRNLKFNSISRRNNGDIDKPLTKSELRLWATMDHEDLIRELPTIEKLSNQERLRLAHKRRMIQLKKFQQYEKDLNSNSKKHRADSDLVRRNLPGKHQQHQHPHGVRKGSRRIRFRNSIMLLEAAGRNDVEEVRLLLESGVNPDVANEDGLTALHQCCIDDNEEMMKILLDYGANVNAEDSEKWTPLHAAATCGHLHLVQYLIVKGANLLAVNAEGNMPYDICDDETTLDYIESEMAKRGVTQELIEEIRALPETRMLQDVQRIHAQGGDLEVRDADGATPLHIASANGYYRVAEFLLDNHVATDVQDKDFWQPIHAAACWGHLDVLELLVQNGADLDARTKNNETPYAICEDPEIKERIIQLRTEQQTKRANEGRKRPSRTHSTNSRTQSIRRTSQRDKGLTSKRDAADEAQMLRAREELHKENSPSPTSDMSQTNGGSSTNKPAPAAVNGNGTMNGSSGHNSHNGNTSSEDDHEDKTLPPPVLGRDSVGKIKMKSDEMNRLQEIAVKSGATNHNNHHQLNNQISPTNNANNAIKMNNLRYNENGSLQKNQNNIQKNLNNGGGSGASGNSPVSVLSSPIPDDNGNLLPKPEINPSVDNKVPLGGLGSGGVSLSGSRDNLVGLSSSAGNSTIDIHVSVTINTNSPVSTLTNGGGHGHTGNSHIPISPGSTIFTPPGTLSDLKKQRSLIRTSSNPLTNGTLTNFIPTSSTSISSCETTFLKSCLTTTSCMNNTTSTNSTPSSTSFGLMTSPNAPTSGAFSPASLALLRAQNSSNSSSLALAYADSSAKTSAWHYYWDDWRNGASYSQSQFDSSAFTTSATSSHSPTQAFASPQVGGLSSSSSNNCNGNSDGSNNNMVMSMPGSSSASSLFPFGSYYFTSSTCSNPNNNNFTENNIPFNNNQHCCYLNNLTGGMNDSMKQYHHPPASPTMSLRRFVGDPAETVGDYGDGGKRCCVIV